MAAIDPMEEKRKILIKEIEHWRRSKLLPEHYCDFLLNIYLEDGKEKPSDGKFLGMNPTKIKNSNWKNWLLIFASIGAISFAVLNFNAFELPMQIGVSLLFLVICYIIGGMKREKEPMLSQIFLGIASLFVLFIGVYLFKLHGLGAPIPVVSYVVLCSLVWILTGLLAKHALIHLCGWVSLVFCYGWLLHQQLDEINWVTLELSWVPLAVVFCWMSWVVHPKSRHTGIVFFLLSLIVWYMPELYAMLYAEQYGEQVVQLALYGKIFVEGLLLFTLRKKWTEWVA